MPRLRVGIVHDITKHRPSVISGVKTPRSHYSGKRPFTTPAKGTAMRRSHIRVGDIVAAHKTPPMKVVSNKGGTIFGQRQKKRRTISSQFVNQRFPGRKVAKLYYQGGRS